MILHRYGFSIEQNTIGFNEISNILCNIDDYNYNTIFEYTYIYPLLIVNIEIYFRPMNYLFVNIYIYIYI